MEQMMKALNEQFTAEMYSAYLYLAMASDLASKGMNGFSNWLRVQAQEENTHAMMFYDFILERGGKVEPGAMEKPPSEWKTPADAFADALKHEQYITGRINDLVDLAIKSRDHATNAFLQWFVTEQVEEEASARDVIDKLKIAQGGMLYALDKEMETRVFTPPAKG